LELQETSIKAQDSRDKIRTGDKRLGTVDKKQDTSKNRAIRVVFA
jgi:hypothetical protein